MEKNIKIYRKKDKFFFTVDKFSSYHHSFLTKHASQGYRYAWEACKDARKIATKHSYHVDALEKFALEDFSKPVVDEVSSENRIADHYDIVYDGLVDTASGMDPDDKLKKRMNYLEAKAVVQEILNIQKQEDHEFADKADIKRMDSKLESILSKIRKLVKKHYREDLENDKKESQSAPDAMDAPIGNPMAPDPMEAPDMEMPLASSHQMIKTAKMLKKTKELDLEELLENYGQRACSAIESCHPSCIYQLRDDGIDIVEGRSKILSLNIGEDLILQDVIPMGKISRMYPYNSTKFYQAYWKPIIERIGHCNVHNNDYIFHCGGKALPDIPKELPFSTEDYFLLNKKSKVMTPFNLVFKGKDNPSWFFEKKAIEKFANTKYNVQEYLQNGRGAIVVCTQPDLPTYYQKTGKVIQLVPFEDHLEVDVDFGNSVFRMTEDQFDILDV